MNQEDLRKIQLAQLDVLKDFKRVCDDHGIRFMLTGGTMLGAVRHKGFIPWDEDIDVAMLRKDYNRFREVAETDLDPQYQFIDWHNDSKSGKMFGKIMIKGTHFLEESAKDVDAEDGIFIDVFALDGVADTLKEEKKDARLMYLWKRVILAKKGYMPADAKGLKKSIYLFLRYLWPVSAERTMRSLERLCEKRSEQDSEYIVNHGGAYPYWKERVKRSCILNTKLVPFEDTMMPVPEEYDYFLSHTYGDYMKLPDPDKRENRHRIIRLDFGEYSIKSKDK